MQTPADPVQGPPSIDPSFIMRTAWAFTVSALGAAALFGVFVSPGGGLTVAYGAVAFFWLSNYTAYRCGATNYRVRPAVAAYAFFASLMLMLVAATSTIFG